MENPSKYDKINSKLQMVMYHQKQWHNTVTEKMTNRMTFFMKYASEKQDFYNAQLDNELNRVTKLFSCRLCGEFADNPITTCLVYANDNKGDVKNGNNRELFKIVINKGIISDTNISVEDKVFKKKIENIINQVEILLQQVKTTR